MKTIKFQDMNDKQVQLSIAGSGDFRIYFEADKDNSPCLLLNECQARIVIHGLLDLIATANGEIE